MLISLFITLAFSAIASPVGCHPYRSPISEVVPYLENVVYFDNNPQMCANDFFAFLKNDEVNAAKNAMWEKALRIAQKNVRILDCGDGKGNVVFINKKVFLTNAHAFYTADENNYPIKPYTAQRIHQCYVLSKGKKVYVDVNTPPVFGDPTTSSSHDYAVGAVEDPINDVAPIELASPEDFRQDQEIMVASAFRDNPIGRNCFSAAICYDRKFWPATGSFTSIHSTNCPDDFGSSGSAEFLISNSGKVVLGHLVSSGSSYTSSTPNGRPYYYSKDLNDPRAAFNLSIGIDGIYRQKIDAFVKEMERRNPPGSLDPQPQSQDAEYVPRGQSL